MTDFPRYLPLPETSFFLLGPRGTGKSTWIQTHVPASLTIDLLETDRFLELSSKPSLLRSLASPLKPGDWVVIDEIQKIPGLLDEVHWLYQKKKLKFAITGSSARKLKKSQANLLAGRLLDIKFFPLVYPELGNSFHLEHCLNFGSLPAVASSYENSIGVLSSYLATYLRQELLEESVIRKLEPFRRFLDIVGMLNGQLLNKENVAREAQVKRSTIDHYYGILEDTLMGSYVEPFCPGFKSKEVKHAKFYLFDPGVVRAAAGLLNQSLESDYLGFMLETFLLGQIRSYLSFNQKFFPVFHYSLSGSYDVDFVVMTRKPVMKSPGSFVNIEAKYSPRFRSEWVKSLNDFAKTCKAHKMTSHIVYTGKDRMEVEGVQVWPVQKFLESLFSGQIL
jgi:predicted AAA+ superfamily ATPase